MKNKSIFRILGALASSLIIVSVFVPYISVTGYASSLWKIYSLTKALYLPIMIIVFGAIGVIFFSLNVKTEFAYMSTGAVLFFVIMQTIEIMDQQTFNTLSIGYYLLVIGAIFTGLMAFLLNLKSKDNDKVINEIDEDNQTSVLDQINNLYNDQNSQEVSPIQPVDVVEPIQLNEENYIQQQENPAINDFSTPEPVVEEPVYEPQGEQTNPAINDFSTPEPVVEEPVYEPQEQQTNPAINDFSTPEQVVEEPVYEPQEQQINPTIEEFNTAKQFRIEEPVHEPQEPQINPVTEEFNTSEPVVEDEQPRVNPATQQFFTSNPGINLFQQQEKSEQPNVVLQGYNNSPFNDEQTDIFGQPINK